MILFLNYLRVYNRPAKSKIIFVGGQPGAGKTVLLGHINKQMNIAFPRCNVPIVGDDLRVFHPMYERLLIEDDKKAAFYTDTDSGKWIEMALECAAQMQSNVLVEGTLRKAEVSVSTADMFKRAGYETECNILAVPRTLSVIGIYQRYFEQVRNTGSGRFTLLSAHDASYEAASSSIEAIARSGSVDIINFYTRGDVKLDSMHPGEHAAEYISERYRQLRDAPMSDEQFRAAKLSVEVIASLAQEFHQAEMSADIERLVEELDAY